MNLNDIVEKMRANDLRVALLGEEMDKVLVNEGGNMFSDVTRIHQENVAATLKYIYSEILPALDIDRKYVQPLGSVGKKLPGGSSGDLDLGIDATKVDYLKDSDNLVKDLHDHCQPILDDMGIESRMIPTLFSIKCPIQNFDGKQEGEFVQLDMMVTRNMKFQTWSNYADREKEGEVYIKGAIRNLIFEAAAHAMDKIKVIKMGLVKKGKEISQQPIEWEEFSFFTAEGLNIKHCKREPMKIQPKGAEDTVYSSGEKSERTLVSNEPDVIASKMFGPKVKGKDLLTWNGAWDAAKNSKWGRDPEQWKIFLDSLREKIIVKMKSGFAIPQVMLDELGLDSEQINESGEFGVNSERKSLTKIHQLNGSQLRNFLNDFTKGIGDSSIQIKTTPKIDGQAYRIAWIDKRTFVETAHSGLMDEEDIMNDKMIPDSERNFFKHIDKKQTPKMNSFLKKHGLSGVKIIGEVLFNGDGLVDDDGTITYVGTTYDAGKIGSNGSLVVFDAKGMQKDKLFDLEEDTKKNVIDFICTNLSDSNVSYYDIQKFAREIQISRSDIPDSIWKQLRETPPEKMKKSQAESIRDEINSIMTKIMREKMPNPKIMKKDDKSIEGVAFELNGNLYGINYQEWKEYKHRYTDEMRSMSDALKNFMAEITGMNPNGKFLDLINTIRKNPEKYQKEYLKMLPDFVKNCQTTIGNARSRTDIPRFIDARSKRVADRLEHDIDPSLLTDDIMSLVELVDGKRIDQNGETIALIPGSFRPPHKGHFSMIKHYSELCDRVIVVVSGQSGDDSKRFDKFNRWMPNHVAGEIIQVYCDAAGLDNVRIVPTENPMKWMAANIRHFKNCKIMLGLSKKDDVSRFSQFTNDKFTSTLDNVEILPIEDNAVDPSQMAGGENISATFIRDHIDDKSILRRVLPDELDDAQFEKVFNMINPGKDGYSFRTDKSRIRNVNEGGHAQSSCPEELRARINQENVKDTLDDIYTRLLPELGLSRNDVEPVGSTGKKLAGGTSGDIDLAMDQQKVIKGTGCETPEEFMDFCEDMFDRLDVYSAIAPKYGWKSVSCFWPIANSDGNQEGMYVQLDFVITNNMRFVTWGMHSDQEQEIPNGMNPDDVNPKSAVRQILIKSIAMGGHRQITKRDENGEDIEMTRLDYTFNEGLFKVTRAKTPKKRGGYTDWKVIKKEFVTDDPDEIVKIIFNDDSMNADDLMSVRDMWDAFLDSPLYADEEIRHEIGRCFEGQMNQHKGRYGYPSWIKFD